jgi:hypothetical protein
MHTLSISIPIWKFTLRIKRQAPGNWNELSKKQLLQLVDILYIPDMDKHEKQIRVTRLLFNLNWIHIMLMSPAQLAWLNTFFYFITDPDKVEDEAEKAPLTDNKITVIKQGRDKYYGPVGDFEQLSGREWTAADEAFREYCQTGEEAQLDQLIAILWRPRNTNIDMKSESFKGDCRMPYNSFTAEFRAKRFAKLDYRIKLVVLLWFRGCRHEWEQVYEKVFSGSAAENIENYGWMETMQKLSGTTFGSLEETENTPMWKLLLKMQIDIKDHEYQESKMKNK